MVERLESINEISHKIEVERNGKKISLYIKNGKDGGIPHETRERLKICRPYPGYCYFHWKGCKSLADVIDFCGKKAEKSGADIILLHTFNNYGKKNEKFAGVLEFYKIV
ncbi:hypothetical protein HZA33_01605 [Candidatus Pacearchaeota archaeon]|nr:hypothetical protein [Candidatus Pacearchaeota archaeon]